MKKTIFAEIKEQATRGVLLVLTGPTGAGKDALFAKLVEDPSIVKIVTTTSREMRAKEQPGNPYNFVSREKFEQLIAEGAFFEWVEFRGAMYGTEKKTLLEASQTGKEVIWHIEAKGVKNIKQKVKEMLPRSVFVYLTAVSVDILKQRVHADEGDGKMIHRWNEPLVAWEMEQYDDCDYLVVNEQGKLEEAVAKVKAIMQAKRLEVILDSA